EMDVEIEQNGDGIRVAPGVGDGGPQRRAPGPGGAGTRRGDADQVGAVRGHRVGGAAVGTERHDRLALRGARGDRRALDREVFAREVDVVQLVAVDEPAGGHVADLRVVLPGVPQPGDD